MPTVWQKKKHKKEKKDQPRDRIPHTLRRRIRNNHVPHARVAVPCGFRWRKPSVRRTASPATNSKTITTSTVSFLMIAIVVLKTKEWIKLWCHTNRISYLIYDSFVLVRGNQTSLLDTHEREKGRETMTMMRDDLDPTAPRDETRFASRGKQKFGNSKTLPSKPSQEESYQKPHCP